MTWSCEVCGAGRSPSFASAWAYKWHLGRAHEPGRLARVVEPGLFGSVTFNEAPPKHPRVWDRWDKGGRSGKPRPLR